MKANSLPVKIQLPALSDEAAVEVYDFLNEFLLLFDAHYFAQIHRFYADRSFDRVTQSSQPANPPNNDPF